LRGGGGNFGIATGFEFRLHPVGPVVLAGPIFWPLDDAPEVLRFVRDYPADAPDELGMVVFLRPAPPGPFVPPEHQGKPAVGVLPVWSGDPAEGSRVLAPLRALGRPIADAVRLVPYRFAQSLLDLANPHGAHYYWRSQRIPAFTDDVIDTLVTHSESVTSPLSYVGCFAIGGAATRVDPGATALGRRDPGFEVNVVAAWPPSKPDAARHIGWVREFSDALRPAATGVYANFLSDEDSDRVAWAYGSRLHRLTALKDRYDPSNVFRFNANIPPSGGNR
jgi:FAD/FMN-containing dehydrogenase